MSHRTRRAPRDRVGRDPRATTRLLCRPCGFPMAEWMNVGDMELHASIWHDTPTVDLVTVDANAPRPTDVPEMDMATSDEIARMIKELGEATTAARIATSELRSAVKDAKHVAKEQERAIRDAIHAEVATAVAQLGDDARTRMADRVDAVVTDLATRLRERLQIP